MNNRTYLGELPSVWAGGGPKRKRGLRILPKNQGYFVHVTSRAVGQAFLFGEAEKRMFRKKMDAWALFSGIQVLTHCLMDNHVHLFLWVPAPGEVPEHREVRLRLEKVWPEDKLEAWELIYQAQSKERQKAMDQAIAERMGDLPEFMRVLKQSFTRWYNRQHDRTGTLWDSRYRSVVVENTPLALMSVAAYVDLNPLRAGLVEDPGVYRWSGYGRAASGDRAARKGLETLVRGARGWQPHGADQVRREQVEAAGVSWKEAGVRLEEEKRRREAPRSWQEVESAYRIWLYTKGSDGRDDPRNRPKSRGGFDPGRVLEEYERRGGVPGAERLRRRIRAFSRGAGIGSPGFLQTLMENYRECFGPKRTRAARPVSGLPPGVQALRQVE